MSENGIFLNFSKIKIASKGDSLPECGITNYDLCKLFLSLVFVNIIPNPKEKQAEKYPSYKGDTSYLR
jgi:hypothetical protein